MSQLPGLLHRVAPCESPPCQVAIVSAGAGRIQVSARSARTANLVAATEVWAPLIRMMILSWFTRFLRFTGVYRVGLGRQANTARSHSPDGQYKPRMKKTPAVFEEAVNRPPRHSGDGD